MIDDFWSEAIKLANLHHPNVVAFYGFVLNGPGGFVVTVMEYVVNSSQGNSILSYWDLIFSPTLVEMEASSTNQHPHFEKMGYGCQHYKRRCKMRAPFCNNFLSCHHYHNEIVNLLSNPFDRHELVRKDVKLFAWLVTLRSRLL
ncbi:hypothetical protein V6N13_123770 [Hibiscus sabdariffa]